MSVYRLGSRRGAVRPSPLFLSVVAIAVAGGVIAWTSGSAFHADGVPSPSRTGDIGVFLLVLGGWVVSVCLHEFAHAYAAYRAGDRGVEARGYLTLNPFKYTHPFLSIVLPLVAIIGGGFALPGGAVYLHPHTFRTRAQRSLAAAVGPLTNVVFAIVLTLIARAHEHDAAHPRFWYGLGFLAALQIAAAVLNLLPVPGLDGYAIIEPYLDPETVRVGEKVKPWGMFVVLVVLFYARQVRNAFFDLVDAIFRAIGGSDLLRTYGYDFFRWWVKSPF